MLFLVVALSMALTPFLAELGQKVGKTFDSHDMKARAVHHVLDAHPSHHSLCCFRPVCTACASTGHLPHTKPSSCRLAADQKNVCSVLPRVAHRHIPLHTTEVPGAQTSYGFLPMTRR